MSSAREPAPPPGAAPGALSGAAAITRGVRRHFSRQGLASVTEFVLANGRRADVMALSKAGLSTLVEVKSSLNDFRTDGKWPDYEGFCDHFYFAVDEAFPIDVLPPDRGLIVADAYDAVILRPAARLELAPARRKALLIRFARCAADRLLRGEDPGLGELGGRPEGVGGRAGHAPLD